MNKKPEIIRALEQIAPFIPFPLYWGDINTIRVLGANHSCLKAMGARNPEDVIGKTPHEYYPKEIADKIVEHAKKVVKTKLMLSQEDVIRDITTGKTRYYSAIRAPLLDSNQQMVAIIGTSIEITAEKESERLMQEQQERFRQIIDVVDANIYWQNIDGHMLGCNQYVLDVFGYKKEEDIIGKTAYDLLPKEEADIINSIDKFVLAHGSFTGEEIATASNGEKKIYYSVKNRLLDYMGNVIGIVGTSLDITAEKESERLRLEQQEQFRKIAAQVAHDIGSPLASLKMIIPHCTTLPENTRSALNKAANRISDIAENFLSQFRPKHDNNLTETQRMPTLIMAEIFEILTEKKYQYNKLPIDFTTTISQAGAFAFINVDVVSFKRMLSNLINNAVDALEGKIGEITIGLDEIDNQIFITVTDNGKGMPDEVKNKISANIEVTSEKAVGHGIGFAQIRETLQDNEGKFDIESRIGVGTTVKLYFPKVDTPNWMAKSIELSNDDKIIILDDDDSIHTAWELRFEKAAPHIKRYHFKQGSEAIEFINSIPVGNRNKIFLLTDYELLKQGLHGLDVIEKTGIKRSILVTSHHNNQLVRDKAKLTNTKILPKLLASEVLINCI